MEFGNSSYIPPVTVNPKLARLSLAEITTTWQQEAEDLFGKGWSAASIRDALKNDWRLEIGDLFVWVG